MFALFSRTSPLSGTRIGCWQGSVGLYPGRRLFSALGHGNGDGSIDEHLEVDDHPDGSPGARLSTALLFYVFVFFEDGQGLLTFLLFALADNWRQTGTVQATSSSESGGGGMGESARDSNATRVGQRRGNIPGILSDERLPRTDITDDGRPQSPAMVKYIGIPTNSLLDSPSPAQRRSRFAREERSSHESDSTPHWLSEHWPAGSKAPLL